MSEVLRSAGRRRGVIAILLIPLALIVVSPQLVAAPPADRGAFDPGSWLQGADGLFSALKRVKSEDKPLVVYFYADWCGYCRQFERELLGTPKVKAFLGSALAVMINPDKGSQESDLARYYGVDGYPTFFVYGRKSQRLARVERMRMIGGRPQLLTPDELVAAIKQAAAR